MKYKYLLQFFFAILFFTLWIALTALIISIKNSVASEELMPGDATRKDIVIKYNELENKADAITLKYEW